MDNSSNRANSSTSTREWRMGLVFPISYLGCDFNKDAVLNEPKEEEFEKKSQVYSNTGTITFIGEAKGKIDFDNLIMGIFEHFKAKFIPQNVVVKVNCYPNIAICIKLSGSKEEHGMVSFLSRRLIAYQKIRQRKYLSDKEKKKREFRNKIKLKVKDHHDSNSKIFFVTTPHGRSVQFNHDLNTTIYKLKLRIQIREGIPPHRQALVKSGRKLQDEQTFADCGISVESFVNLIISLIGGHPTISLLGLLACSICLELLYAPMTLNCSHSFCQYCIGRWREEEKKTTCPFCRELIESENRVHTLDKILEKVESEMDKQEDKDKREEQKRKHAQFMENRQRQVTSIEEPLVNPVIETATTEFVISNGRLAQARIQFDSGHDITYNEGNSEFDTFCNGFNSDQDYQDFDADLQI